MAFVWADYLVCILLLLVSSAVGVYYRFTGDKQRTNREYLLANKSANVWTVAFSLMATFMSSITLLGVSAENYTFGTHFIIINLSYGVFTPVAAYLYLPVFYKLQTTSVYEYLERRFGAATRLVASLAFSLQMILYMGIVVFAPALALETLTEVDQITSVFIIGIVCTFYATLGGMKAVLLTDLIQSILMFGAVICVVGTAVAAIGFDGIWETAELGGRIEFFNFSVDPTTRHTWFTNIIGGGLTFLSLYAVNQAQVQRYLSVKDLKSAQKSLFLNWPILSALSLITSFSGLAIFSKYILCDPIITKRITQMDQLMPQYVLDSMGGFPGISGLFAAGIFSGSLSTVSGALNSLAAVTIEDYLKPLIKRIKGRGMEESLSVFWTKLLCVGYGICCLAVAFAARYLGGVLQTSLTVFGIIGGPLLGVFTLGMFFPSANEIGALTSLFVSVAFGLFLGFGKDKPPQPVLPTWATEEGCKEFPDVTWSDEFKNRTVTIDGSKYMYLYRISYQWYIVLGLLLAIAVGLFVSMIASKCGYATEEPHPDLFTPFVAKRLRKKRQTYSDVTEIENNEKTTVILRRVSPQRSEDQIKTIS
ncbi:UNVERIFIED_CONTAM: hypothetical protein PYX00_007183 [Menopon gallinae]|uniref:Sodium-dependent multivitamin transporter n=1 Tax=Menopon gallinae TaxID=328185 RepID=A0AAW2HHS5_9NEOP